jgi:hypothetical protein
VIQAVVEDETPVASVSVLYRAPGASRYERVEMTRVMGHSYESQLEISAAFAQGLEYFIEAIDEGGARGTDGSTLRPYLLMVQEGPPMASLGLSTMADPQKATRPLWKRRWFWFGTALAVTGGLAIANSGGNENNNSGTVVVE